MRTVGTLAFSCAILCVSLSLQFSAGPARGADGSDPGPGFAGKQPPFEPKSSVGLIPLTDLGTGKYKNEAGGLYGGGSNVPPPEHLAAAQAEAAKIQPLDDEGQSAANGKIVLLSVGMSNTANEFSRFMQIANADPQKSSKLVIIQGAQGNQPAAAWAAKDATVWGVVDQRLKMGGVSGRQVQVAWIKQANFVRSMRESVEEYDKELQSDMLVVLNQLKEHYPNLKLAYLSSRIYGGYAGRWEPYAYEGGFVMRRLIRQQIAHSAKLNCDPARGTVHAPLLLWGPYLWADGVTPRKYDGLVWERKDLSDVDGTHPSASGCQKVADLLLKLFKTDPTAQTWFLQKPTAD